ncbi:uncharacterized protein HMPREF1541_05782 [Cyphellophora europaea CBS 101466]|uniref:USP domain-containing protein n=1 Tax=Cyphellophora europaea (strain CBS 101466) TaxID=1220924 RepID=W2RSR7_CYPE1|nr:uncharacterized protein HMPREF1541_05782 [Cyphellophora europaea CBS 101466]ETN39556.1 hypothetical protein HMPREF1541_05782 [Cyphellophora europaea CBS 101466]
MSSLPESVRNRSNSGDDAELPTHDRKRPRLSESGDKDSLLPNLSISAPQQTIESPTPSPTEPASSETLHKPTLPPRPSDTMATPSPTSKVTINTRPLSSQSMNTADDLPPTEEIIDPALIVNGTVDTVPVDHVDPTASEATTIERSPSPPIEVAEPEDFDQDPAQTRWTTRIGGGVPVVPAFWVYRTFPLATGFRPGESRFAVSAIAQIFADPSKEDVDTFRRVKEWFVNLAADCEAMTREIVDQDPFFWKKLPIVLDNLWRRDQRGPSSIQFQDMVDFFVAYGQICKLIFEYDTRQLSSLQDNAPSSDFYTLSGSYLLPFNTIVSRLSDTSPNHQVLFFDSLRRRHQLDVMALVRPIAERVASPLLNAMNAYTKALGETLPKAPALHKDLIQVTTALTLATQLFCPVFKSSPEYCAIDQSHPLLEDIRESVEASVTTVDNIVQQGIKKQQAWFSFENNALMLFQRLEQIMSHLPVEIPRMGKSIVHAAGVTWDDADVTDLAHIMPYAWKFMIYWKFIKHGRMELRVHGLGFLSQDLISIFNLRLRGVPNGAQDPLVRFALRSLRENNVISYLIGPDSHPQLIGRAGNIIGFFGVSGSYQNSDTDTIWQAILGSPDNRVAAELFNMLREAITTFTAAHLYYLCQKLSELPYSRWNVQVLEFTEFVLSSLNTTLQAPSPFWFSPPVEPVVRRLCLKMIRDAMRPKTCDLELSEKIRTTFLNQLIGYFRGIADDFTRLAIEEDEEDEMLSQIRTDIESHDDAACGSILAITHILQNGHLNHTGTVAFIEKCGLPRGLVDDLAHISISSANRQELSSQQILTQFDYRLNCLSLLMRTVPEQFDLECLESLWSSLLVSSSIEQQARVHAWDHLHFLVKAINQKRNPVVDQILQHFWPRLRSIDINNAVLEFAKSSVLYDCHFGEQSEDAESEIVQIPGLDRVKQIMLDAEPGTVEGPATEFIIAQYLRSPILARRPKSVVHATHLNLIDHWVGAVLGSAAQLKSFSEGEDAMQIIASEDGIRREERHFDRSLLFLRRFTEAIKGNPGCSPISPKQEEAFPEFPSPRGPARDIIVEIGSNKYVVMGERKVSIGSENTGSELWHYLATVTGFSSFKVFHGGQLIALQEELKTIEKLNITAKVQVQKTADATQTMPQKRLRSSSPVDEKIMLHFDDLYGLLEADDRLAKEVYTFLTITSVRKEVSQKIRDMEAPASDVLPCEKPYKLLFCTHALRACIEEESFSASPDLAFVSYAVQAIVVALHKLDRTSFDSPLQLSAAYEAIDTLLLAFRTKVPPATGKLYIANHEDFVDHVVRYTSSVKVAGGQTILPQNPEKPIRAGIEALVEASLHDDRIWQHLNGNKDFIDVFQQALIGDVNEKVRQAVVDVFMGLTGQAGFKNVPKANDPRAARSRHDSATIEAASIHIWNILLGLLPVAAAFSSQCQEYFDATLGVLRRMGKVIEVQALAGIFPQWTTTLLAHDHTEIVGQPLADRFVAGMIPMLQEIARLLRSQQCLPAQSELMRELIGRFLRPPLSDVSGMACRLPVLDMTVRECLYSLLLTLCQEPEDAELLVTEFGEDFDVSDQLPAAASNERLALRSEVGYSGLRNLSNTCYLNSLLSQLFMNVQFRDLILQNGANARNQKLVWELSKVFAYMQNSHDKSIDPSAAVESITTWDGEQIDVTVQMDVDEFFNLLFDRLESETVDPSVRAQLKSFYGGETIQQIKSKECEHISERPETFSVLPVEIKGKASLQESLKAYVEGEVLQGDNKYSCTSCAKHVDAVKRSCLKQIPDNLILNLKRFDFDLVTCMRAKLNDQFEFPETIDMAPYKLDNLSGDNDTPTPDVFELTGIIVHSGTADSGHYYSYIRQRPSADEPRGSWVQFNDSDVTVFDSSTIGDYCFGGIDASIYGMAKFYNAYMLFYQRRSSIVETEMHYPKVQRGQPLQLSISHDLQEHIDQENELFLRAYCMQDPVHARFIRDLLRRVNELGSGQCSEDHNPEKAALGMALDYMHKVSSRWKLLPELEVTANIVKSFMQRCTTCAWTCMSWFARYPNVLMDSTIRSMYPLARKTFASMLLTCLQALQQDIDQEGAVTSTSVSYYRFLDIIVENLFRAFQLVTRTPRAWVDYFNLVIGISNISPGASRSVIETGFIERCFEMVHLHTLDAPDSRFDRAVRAYYAGYVNMREKHRQFNHSALVQCFAHLLCEANLELEPDAHQRQMNTDGIGLSASEQEKMGLAYNPMAVSWLQRLIKGRQAVDGAAQIVGKFASEPQFADDMARVLRKGLGHRDMQIAAGYVEPTLAFCQNCHDESMAEDMARFSLESVDSITVDYAPEYLRLVRGLLRIDNQHPDVAKSEGWLQPIVQETASKWPASLILGLNETGCNVRAEAAELVNAQLFAALDEAKETDPQRYHQLRNIVRELALNIAKCGRTNFLNVSPRENQSMQLDHFNEAMLVADQCVRAAFSDASTAEDERDLAEIEETMNQLRSKRESIVELVSPGDFEGSSDMEGLSEVEGDEFHSSPT